MLEAMMGIPFPSEPGVGTYKAIRAAMASFPKR